MRRVSGGYLPTLNLKVGRVLVLFSSKREGVTQTKQGPNWVAQVAEFCFVCRTTNDGPKEIIKNQIGRLSS